MIISGGENVYCTEVEDALYAHAAVLEATVFGIPSERWGEAVHAVVVLRSDATEAELIDHCRTLIAGYKVPRSISFQTDPLPKSGPGKVLKRELRAPFWSGHDTAIGDGRLPMPAPPARRLEFGRPRPCDDQLRPTS